MLGKKVLSEEYVFKLEKIFKQKKMDIAGSW